MDLGGVLPGTRELCGGPSVACCDGSVLENCVTTLVGLYVIASYVLNTYEYVLLGMNDDFGLFWPEALVAACGCTQVLPISHVSGTGRDKLVSKPGWLCLGLRKACGFWLGYADRRPGDGAALAEPPWEVRRTAALRVETERRVDLAVVKVTITTTNTSPPLVPIIASFISKTSFTIPNSNRSLQLCSHYDRLALIEFNNTFSLYNLVHDDCTTSYPKTKSWRKGKNCCSWDASSDFHTSKNSILLRTLYILLSFLPNLLPKKVLLLPNLQLLYLRDLSIDLPMSNWSTPLRHLQLSLLDSTRELSFPESICNLTSLQIPSSISNLTELEFLSLPENQLYNQFTGGIKDFQSKSLRKIIVSNNKLQGPIPSSIFDLTTSLEIIDMSNNKLQGPIPSSVFCQINLTRLFMSSNNLTSVVGVDEFLKLKNSKKLDLSSNSLSLLNTKANHKNTVLHNLQEIPVPPFKLEFFLISANNLTGKIPTSFCNMYKIKLLDISKNALSGIIPECIESLTNSLELLHLQNNSFHGKIPSMARFCHLGSLNINDNQFEGPLPRSLATCKDLEILNLGNNMINETFPHWLQTLPKLQLLVLKSNQFRGPILDYKAIDLSNNKFEGEVSEVIGNLSFLKGLNFSHNLLSGHIPSSMGNLIELEWLDFSCNMLGKQFNTFDSNSYKGNSGLCRFPLSKTYGDDGASPQSQPLPGEEDDSGSGFDWKIIMMGYSCGLVLGLYMGYIVFITGKPQWLVRLVEGS
ncbi:receptor-like protein Cf-9 homolog [Tripterygium wilfordii]|uniref:receptor-like protein Cf-9 homolog n=1 Tax=Tripterygium wilfordii TaxID=458696 RepID=UPI0018F85862|nr:receptor-like protein Cf-9 homolog [Tripterygium wilfordii]